MTEQQLDECYTQLCHAMSALDEDQAKLLLARLTLLLMHALDDPGRIREAIAEAAKIS
jgi:Protein of unknown function (DUF2783)